VIGFNLGFCISLRLLKMYRGLNVNDHTPVYAFVQMVKMMQPKSRLPASIYNKFRVTYYQYRYAISEVENLAMFVNKGNIDQVCGLSEFISNSQTGCYGCGRKNDSNAVHHICMDGNFRLNRRRKNKEDITVDNSLSISFIEGTAILARSKDDVQTCGSNFRAGDGIGSARRNQIYSETGIYD
jgi:hypothetical protein